MKRLFLASLVSATLIGCGGSDGGDKKPTTPEQPDTSIPTTPLEPSTPVDPENPDQPLIPLEPSITPPTETCNEWENSEDEDCWDNGFTNPNEPEKIDTLKEFAEILHTNEMTAREMCSSEWNFRCYVTEEGEPTITFGGFTYYPRKGYIYAWVGGDIVQNDIYNENTEVEVSNVKIEDQGTQELFASPMYVETFFEPSNWNEEEIYARGITVFKFDYGLLQNMLTTWNIWFTADYSVIYDNGFEHGNTNWFHFGVLSTADEEEKAIAAFTEIASYWTSQQ
ncbi:hypothetical protein ABXV18_03165 [Vibrio owensii]|uniref:hypothetical protein n=1 Tax=Vibrio owensii TaxID=696485 RepID=UPI00339A3D8F